RTLFLVDDCAFGNAADVRPGDCSLDAHVEGRAMRNASTARLGAIVIVAVVQGLATTEWVGASDHERPAGLGIPGRYRPWAGEFDVQVLVGGRPLPQAAWRGERRVEAVAGTEYQLRLTN